MSADVAVDTSAAVPFVLHNHAAHHSVVDALDRHRPALSGHALFETYSVLTRLPSGARLLPGDALTLLLDRFEDAVLLDQPGQHAALEHAAGRGIRGGALYDALVGFAARIASLPLLTRDRRALGTYATVDAEARLLPD